MVESGVGAAAGHTPHIIVIGNEKGGSGKSTTAMHLIAGLLHRGLAVGSIDLDAGQATLTRYVENRRRTNSENSLELALPDHRRLPPSDLDSAAAAAADDKSRLEHCVSELAASDNIIVIATPGSDIAISRHRVGALAARNNAAMDRSLSDLAGRIGFRIAPGFTERVIFRELFLQGLTLLDLRTPGVTQRMNSSHIAARQEVRQLLVAIGLPNPPETAQNSMDSGH